MNACRPAFGQGLPYENKLMTSNNRHSKKLLNPYNRLHMTQMSAPAVDNWNRNQQEIVGTMKK
ncbi:MAG TPA: hypothetical protein VK983_05470 [Candidatus Limnocylindrales bacterium]|nr:hypothetical protein [Candidatus Limnocylindrales bacterium]